MAERADHLAELSARLTRQTASYLEADELSVRLGAEQHLLAQAVASLRVADGLLAAAADLGETPAPAATRGLPSATQTSLDDVLALLQAPLADTGLRFVAARTASRGGSLHASRQDLMAAVEGAFDQIVDSVVAFGRDALAGLAGLDTALLQEAASMLSKELGQLVETLGEQASRLAARAAVFVVRAYDSLLAALGQEAASTMRQAAGEWLQRLQQGETLASLLDLIYETRASRQRIGAAVEASQAREATLAQARDAVAALPAGLEARLRLPHQVLAGLGVITRLAPAPLPPVEALRAADAQGPARAEVAHHGGAFGGIGDQSRLHAAILARGARAGGGAPAGDPG